MHLANNISKRDYTIIKDVVDAYGFDRSYDDIKKILRKIFAHEISDEHYIVLGWIIRESLLTETRGVKSNYNLNENQN